MRSLLNEKGSWKVVLLGNSGAGKTSLLQCLLSNPVSPENQPTIGCEYHEIPIVVDEAKVPLKVWDTAGQEVYRSIVPIYVRDASAALLVYDITDETSFQSLDHWRSLLLEQQNEEVFLFVVANKNDLEARKKVDDKVALQFAEKNNAEFFKVSALKDIGVKELFRAVAKSVQGKGVCQTQRKIQPQENKAPCCVVF